LAPGETRTVTVQYTVRSDAPVGPFQSVAAVTSTTTDVVPGNNQQTDTTAVGLADLVTDISTGGYSPTVANGVVVLTVTVTNNGAVEARDVVSSVGVVSDLTLDSVSGCVSGNAGACSLGSILPGESKTFTVTATVGGTPSSPITVTSTATTTVTESNLGNNGDTATLVILPGTPTPVDVAVTSATVSPGLVVAGDGTTGRYTTRIENVGTNTANSVVLTQTIPSGLTIAGPPMVVVGGVATTCAVAGQVVTCSVTNPLGVGAGVTIETPFTVGAGVSAGTRGSTATVTTTSFDSVPANNTKTAALMRV
jgi:uncharacterized repeat protein (TIGR01451 family)